MGKSAYGAGIRDSLPFILIVVPFGLLFGVVASEAGMPLVQIMVMTTLVIAGAAQFAALQLMIDDASLWLIVGSALAVNLRMAMYSASLAPWIGAAPLWQRACAAYLLFDQPYALSIGRYETRREMTVPQRMAYYFGTATPIAPLWIVATAVGAVVGEAIPEGLALDFALPITFIAMVAPMLRTIAHVAAAFVSILVSLPLSVLPAGTGLLIAAGCAMVTGALVETWRERRA